MHSSAQNNHVSMTKETQKHLYKEHRKHRVIDQGKYGKRGNKRKWTYIDYHVQDNVDIAHKEVKMYCNTDQFLTLSFCGPHPKPHVARGLIENYNSCFDPKLGHDIYAIFCIPCACVACTSMLDKPSISIITKKNATNLSQIVPTGQLLAHPKIGISFT